MRFITINFFFALIATFLISLTVIAQTKVTVEDIVKNPKTYENDEVEFAGLVTQYVKGRGATSYYLIKGDFGGILKVNTAEDSPQTNKKYKVVGIAYRDRSTLEPYISEKERLFRWPLGRRPEDHLGLSELNL